MPKTGIVTHDVIYLKVFTLQQSKIYSICLYGIIFLENLMNIKIQKKNLYV